MDNITVRGSKFAKVGLIDMCNWLENKSGIPLKEMRMFEIGSFVGDSTEIFAQRFKEVISIDPYKNGYDASDTSSHKWPMDLVFAKFKANILDKYPNVIHYHTTSEEGSNLFANRSFDFGYVDGNHLYEFVKLDLVCWLPKIKIPGWIAGHDYQNRRAPGVMPAVLEMLDSIDERFRDTSWIKRLEK